MRLLHLLGAAGLLAGIANPLALAATTSPAQVERPAASAEPPARFLPPLEEIVGPAEQALLASLQSSLSSTKMNDPEATHAAVSALDSVLAKVREPTKFRGFIQYIRAGGLMSVDRHAEAMDAVKESVRLLPGYSAPLIAAAIVHAYNNQAAVAADYLLRASRLDPASVRKVDDYEVGNIMRRLTVARDEKRYRALADRLLEINWTGESLTSQSSLALVAIQRHVESGDVDAARALVPKLLVPSHAHSLLVDRRYQPLWPDVEAWTGARLQKSWRSYLTEARERWGASQATATLEDHVEALIAARHYNAAIKVASPILLRPLDPDRDIDLQQVFRLVGSALVVREQWGELDRLYEHALRVWPLGRDANALNISGNRARYFLSAGEPAKALELMNKVLADARRWGGEVNLDALGAMHHARACALHELGRSAEATTSVVQALSVATPVSAAGLHLCLDNAAAARSALHTGLQDKMQRSAVLLFMQPETDEGPASGYTKRIRLGERALRSDPALVAEAAKYGRILPYSLAETAPPE